MIVFFRLTSGLIALVALITAAFLLVPGGSDTLARLAGWPPAAAALALLVGAVGASFLWAVAELIQRARQALLILDPPNMDRAAGRRAEERSFEELSIARRRPDRKNDQPNGDPLLDPEVQEPSLQ